MKKFLLFFGLIACSFVFSSYEANQMPQNEAATIVYICNGKSATKYHSHSDCRGLGNCSTSISAVTLADAQRMGRTPCKICYN